MGLLRRLLAQRYLVTLLCCAVLALKVVVPAGFMVSADDGRITVKLCSGTVGAPAELLIPVKRDSGMPDTQHREQHAVPCPYASLAFSALNAVDPIQLARLVAFILAVGLVGMALPSREQPVYLRPPLRGPPARL